MPLVDNNNQNTAFCSELNRICKKERGFISIYKEALVPFMLSCASIYFERGERYDDLVARHKIWVASPSWKCAPPSKDPNDLKYCFLKFRTRFSEKDRFSAGPRITLAIGPKMESENERLLIPLEIYTHGMKGNEDATDLSDLRKRLRTVLRMLKPIN